MKADLQCGHGWAPWKMGADHPVRVARPAASMRPRLGTVEKGASVADGTWAGPSFNAATAGHRGSDMRSWGDASREHGGAQRFVGRLGDDAHFSPALELKIAGAPTDGLVVIMVAQLIPPLNEHQLDFFPSGRRQVNPTLLRVPEDAGCALRPAHTFGKFHGGSEPAGSGESVGQKVRAGHLLKPTSTNPLCAPTTAAQPS
jgi:hypothetical protein